ncbi:MAG: protein translocase subunit SecD [Candidatus Eremiobacteraeota bacterium]|nr:protein translocase subunit SecD [Candidatus Eremiobacteraeota bacterium]
MWLRSKNWVKGAVVLAVVGLCLYLVLPIQQKIKLGLDLQGGVRVLLQLNPSPEVPAINQQIQGQVVQVIDNRINGLGVSEPVITRVGSDRILVELPNVKNPDEAVKTLKEVATLDFKIVPPQVVQRAETDKKYANDPNGAYKASGPVVYSGADLKGAQASFDQSNNPKIDFQTKNPAKFGKLTQDNMGKPLGIFLDKKFVSAPTIQGVITSDGQITGQFTEEDVVRIANELNAGALPVPVTIIENDTVGPLLGLSDLEKSLWASIVGLGLVLIFMIVVYRLPGALADLALIVYVLMLLGLLASAKAVLTLPGIAGFVLSIGMAVDANVLIFERLKEELWAGRSLRAAVRTGFGRAFWTVFDSHFTTIVGAGVLFMLGTGTVKGFAYTLFWGTAFSMVTAVFITRYFTDVFVDNNLVTNPKAYGV